MIYKILKHTLIFSSSKNQLIPFFFFFVASFSIIMFSLKDFKSFEKISNNFVITKNINNKLEDAFPVKVSFNIQNFSNLNIAEGLIDFDGNILFEFDPLIISEKEIEAFNFESSEITSKIKIIDKLINGKRVLGYAIKLKLNSNFNFHLFPIDDHKIYMILTNNNLDNKKINYIGESFVINSDLSINDWIINKKSFEEGLLISSIILDNIKIEYPALLYEIDIMRYGNREILLVFIPIFIMFFLSILVFSYGGKSESGIINVTSSIVATLIAYRFTINSLMPSTSHLTLADYLFLYFFFIGCLSFYFSCFDSKLIDKYRGLILIITYIISIFFLYYILFIS